MWLFEYLGYNFYCLIFMDIKENYSLSSKIYLTPNLIIFYKLKETHFNGLWFSVTPQNADTFTDFSYTSQKYYL